MNKRVNPLGIREGDTVEIFFDHQASRGTFMAEVTKVTDRTTMGYEACIDYKPEESARDLGAEDAGIPYGCSVSFVTKIVKRAPYTAPVGLPVNIFRNEIEDANLDGFHHLYKFGGTKVSFADLGSLVIRALASAKDTLEQSLDMDRFMAMWEKDCCRGKIALPDNPLFNDDPFGITYVAVNWKVFKKYVLVNRHRILHTRKEMENAGIKMNEEIWRDMEDDPSNDPWDQETSTTDVDDGYDAEGYPPCGGKYFGERAIS